MQAATDTVARVTDRHPEVSGPGRVSGEGAGSGRVESRRSGQAPAGAARFLEQRLHPAVCREPAPPGRSRVQLLREARGCVSRGGGEQGERAARRALHPHSLASRPPPHFAEHSDKWKVMHLKVSYSGERVAASGTGPAWGSAFFQLRTGQRPAGTWSLEVRVACPHLSQGSSVPCVLERSAHLRPVGAREAARSFLPCRGFWGSGSSGS